MKRLFITIVMLLFIPTLLLGQQVVFSFDAPQDSSFWIYDHVTSSDTSGVLVTYSTERAKEGPGSLRLDWLTQATEGWGGFANILHLEPDSQVYDFSLYTHLSLWYYNAVPSTHPTTVEFRILFHDVSDAPANLPNVLDSEFWYSHHKILDAEPGWNQILMPLEDVGMLSDQGFWLPGWAGAPGNGKLDLNKIKGIKFEFSIDASLYNADNPQASGFSQGTIFLDQLTMVGHRNPVINFFDTTSIATNYEITGTGTSSITVTDNAAEAFEDNAAQFDWAVDADQGWGGFASIRFNEDDFLPDMSGFSHLSMRYNNLVPSDQPGNVVFRIQLHEYSEGEDQEEIWFYETTAILDSAAGWNQLLIPLTDRGLGLPPNAEGFSNPGWGGVPGNEKLDWDKVKSYEFAFSAAQQGTFSKGTLLLDNLELAGFRETDFTAPNPPQGVSAKEDPDNRFNLVIWQDVPGETGEKYDVYASQAPITDLKGPGVEIIATDIPENTQTFAHFLFYPLEDKEVSYYYAVTAKDAAGNVSKPGYSESVVNNVAKGIPTISLNPPANFVADGDLSEWENSGIRPFVLKPSESHIALGTFDSDDDFSPTVYMAVDDEYLYLAADVIDDVHSFDPAGNFWEDDMIELYIGFYDGRPGPKHAGFLRGEEPDYKLHFRGDYVVNEFNDHQQIYTPDSVDYHYEGFGSDWVVETRMKLTDIAFADDKVLKPVNGMRLPFDIVFHDSDAPNVRDGAISFSPLNNDNSYLSPRNWAVTWIGDQPDITTAVEEERLSGLPSSYALRQNYPNPFNPSTTISYSLPQPGQVTIVLYNAVGQKVRTLVDAVKAAGNYRILVDARDLASGLYFYQITAGSFKQTRKMVFMK